MNDLLMLGAILAVFACGAGIGLLRPAGQLVASRTIDVYGFRPGDDLVLSPPDWAADEDVVGLLNTVQAQFPGVRIHLLAGFGPIYISGEQRRKDREASGHEAQPKISIADQVDQARASGAPTGPQGNVVVLTHCAGGRVIAVSVPPEA